MGTALLSDDHDLVRVKERDPVVPVAILLEALVVDQHLGLRCLDCAVGNKAGVDKILDVALDRDAARVFCQVDVVDSEPPTCRACAGHSFLSVTT